MSDRDRRVEYRPWERNAEIAPALGPSYGFGNRYLGMRAFHAMRRKVYVSWRDGGQKMGYWEWQDGGVA